jgi:hypothetical protein
MSNRKVKAPDASQATISHVFGAAVAKKTPAPAKAVAGLTTEKKLTSDDTRVQAFYDSLSPKEVIAHSIAVEKLGTSYDVTRTHGFLKWCKANPA